ncbi:USP domain-containing protein [Caenorhabditis elegans]|uniref:USP domain-containing protein n=1 Tax=Caenorhabditis elegans TaxID=6239 RepID=G5ECF3_CAEEL|nr:USP domain-containing protein [Caenorhabditis elegans]CAA91345.4 USP domain-containing protein [Caenorhabditis elegans]|eukprot:NP_497710.4 Uncharacterized protein CELE_K01A11.3 [Caenorhabditis elegans]
MMEEIRKKKEKHLVEKERWTKMEEELERVKEREQEILDKLPGLKLQNPGNSCFLNVAIQMMQKAGCGRHFKRTCETPMHKQLKWIFDGKKETKDATVLRSLLSDKTLKTGAQRPFKAFNALMEDLSTECGARHEPLCSMFSYQLISTLKGYTGGCGEYQLSIEKRTSCLEYTLGKRRTFLDVVASKEQKCLKKHTVEGDFLGQREWRVELKNSKFLLVNIRRRPGQDTGLLDPREPNIFLGNKLKLVGFVEVEMCGGGEYHAISWTRHGDYWTRHNDDKETEIYEHPINWTAMTIGHLFLFEKVDT